MGRKNDDDASKWTGSDMNDDQAKLEEHWVIESTTYMTEEEWKRAERMLKRNAASQGKVIGSKKERGGYKITVERREMRKKK
jgi:hypothetical protein